MQNGNVIEVVLQLVDQVTKPLEGISTSISRMGSTIAGVLGTVAGGWTLVKFAQNIAEADRVAMSLDQAFINLGKNSGMTREKMDELASSIQRVSTFGDESVKSAQAMLLTFTKVQGEAFERTIRAAADMSAALGTDITASVRRLGYALQDPVIGMMLLRRSGIALTAQQREQIKEMVKLGDTAGAQNKILELLEGRYKGTAQAMRNTLSGAVTGLQNAIGDLVEGDRGSFKGAIEAINNLAKAMDSPNTKAGFDKLIAGMALSVEWAARLAVAFGGASVALGEFFAKAKTGNTLGTEPLDVLYSQIDRLKKERDAIVAGTFDPKAGVAPKAGQQLIRMPEAAALKRVQEINAAMDALRKQVGQVQDEYIALERSQSGAYNTLAKQPALEMPKIDVDEATGNFRKLQESYRTELQKTADSIRDQQQIVSKMYMLSDEDLALEGLTRGDIDKQVAQLNMALDAAVQKANDSGKKIAEAMLRGLTEIEITARPIGKNAMDELFRGMDDATKTGFAQQLEQWFAFVAQVEELQKRGLGDGDAAARLFEARKIIGPLAALEEIQGSLQTELERTAVRVRELGEQIAKLYAMSDENLLKLGLNRGDLDAAVAGLDKMIDKAREGAREVNEFQLQAARQIQSTFADAFMAIGEGWDGIVKGFLDGFKRIFAEAAALQLAKALGLDEILGGKAATGGVGKLIEKIFPAQRKAPSSGAAGGAATSVPTPTPVPAVTVEVPEIVMPEIAPPDYGSIGAEIAAAVQATQVAGDVVAPVIDCAPMQACAEQAVTQIGAQIDQSVTTATKTYGESFMAYLKQAGTGLWSMVRGLTSGLWKTILTMLGRLWEFIKGAIAAIRTMAAGSGGSSSGGLVSTAASVVAAYFGGGSAGGGIIPANKPRLVGEEGPELIFPTAQSQVMNTRQMAFAGAGQSINYSPRFDITINGAKDDAAMFTQLAAYVERRDQKVQADLMEMMRRNGYGRMRR